MIKGKYNLANVREDLNNAEVKLTLLRKTHPEIALALNQKHLDLMPEIVFKDFGLIADFLIEFCNYHKITIENVSGLDIIFEYHTLRKQFFALILLCFHPEKIVDGGITHRNVIAGLLLCTGAYLCYPEKSLAMLVKDVVVSYKTYKDFYEPVNEIHQLIVEKYKHRVNEKQVRIFSSFSKKL